MNRLFLKVYVGIAVVLTIGTVGTLYILTRGFDAARQRSFEERLIDSAEFIKARVQADNLFHEEEELWRLSRAARIAFDIKPQSEVADDIVEQLTYDGETFVQRDGREMKVYSLFLDGQVLIGRFGRRDRRGGERARDAFGGFRPGPEGRPRPDRWPGFDRGPGPPGPSGAPGSEGWGYTRNLFLLSVIGIPILLVGPAIYFLIRPLDRRIHALSGVAERFGEGELDSRAESVESDAFGELTGTFNRMADQIKNLIDGQNELLRAVSHELRTPLARLFFMLDDAEAAESESERQKQLQRIQQGLTDMNDLVEELLTYVRMDQDGELATVERVSVAQILEEMPEVISDLRDDVTTEVTCRVGTLDAVPRLFRRAVLNLVTNAARHSASRVQLACWAEGQTTFLAVDDDGSGVPDAQRDRILQPFIRADESRSSRIGGVGLGLAIVNRVMIRHSGTVSIADSPIGGARFLLAFPSSNPA